MNELRIGLVSVSDRASSGVYEDKGQKKQSQRLFISNHV